MVKKRTFWDRVQESMRDNGLKPTQKAAAKLIGISQPSVNKWTKGGMPRMEHAVAMASKLGVCVEWLFLERGPKHPLDADASALLNAWNTLPSGRLKDRALAYIQGLTDRGPEPLPPSPTRPRLS